MLKYEDLIAELRQRPLEERLSLLEELAHSIKQEVTIGSTPQAKTGAKSLNLAEFDPNWRPSREEAAQNQAWLDESQSIAEEIGQQWPQNISAADAIREDRREL
jgi:hypothetical protein